MSGRPIVLLAVHDRLGVLLLISPVEHQANTSRETRKKNYEDSINDKINMAEWIVNASSFTNSLLSFALYSLHPLSLKPFFKFLLVIIFKSSKYSFLPTFTIDMMEVGLQRGSSKKN
ncbi:PREDICTED: uncharacterized protein LOC108529430 [Rhinopithecus bieti]|uniref:uncharacterized protein LOC108529430 n=1 Tax=Rhinopithecus bieti TaxID=61621 RepID=UPI00083BED03|nr:PREDICTED: uncharacterized protein LOC108529430 [Rhinopithecus bieti]